MLPVLLATQGAIGATSQGKVGISITIPVKETKQATKDTPPETNAPIGSFNVVRTVREDGTILYILEMK